jgi:hypothetical protein
MMCFPAAVTIALAEASPDGSFIPSTESFTVVNEDVSLAKFCADFLLSMMRSNSMPPCGFLASLGTTNASPAWAQMVSKGIASELSRPDGGATVISKPGGVVSLVSFSTQVPLGTNSALPLVHSVCDWV